MTEELDYEATIRLLDGWLGRTVTVVGQGKGVQPRAVELTGTLEHASHDPIPIDGARPPEVLYFSVVPSREVEEVLGADDLLVGFFIDERTFEEAAFVGDSKTLDVRFSSGEYLQISSPGGRA